MNKEITISDFSPHLFWDVDLEKFEWNRYKNYIVFKVLEEGNIADWNLVKEIYGSDEIKLVSQELEGLNIVTLSFLSTIYHIDITSFKSYHPLLTSKDFRQKVQKRDNFDWSLLNSN